MIKLSWKLQGESWKLQGESWKLQGESWKLQGDLLCLALQTCNR
jgi:hypothetical protein